MEHYTALLLFVICGFAIVYLSFLYRERWHKEMWAFNLIFAEQGSRYPYNKKIIWLDSPASIHWDNVSDEICVICITNNLRAATYGSFFFDSKSWRWRNSPPPGDRDLIKSIIADTLTNAETFVSEEPHLEDLRMAPDAFSSPKQFQGFAKD